MSKSSEPLKFSAHSAMHVIAAKTERTGREEVRWFGLGEAEQEVLSKIGGIAGGLEVGT